MKRNKLTTFLCALCVASSAVVGFSACEELFEYQEENVTPAAINYQVTQEGWNAAFANTTFLNCTGSFMQTSTTIYTQNNTDNDTDTDVEDDVQGLAETDGETETDAETDTETDTESDTETDADEVITEIHHGSTLSGMFQTDLTKVHLAFTTSHFSTAELGISNLQFYFSQEETGLYGYSNWTGEGFMKTPAFDVNLSDINFSNLFGFTIAGDEPYDSDDFSNAYALFTYNEATKAYTAARIQPNPEDATEAFTDVTVKFENGKPVYFSANLVSTVENRTEITEYTFTFGCFGTTSITLPTPIGEGPLLPSNTSEITERDWVNALSAENFENVTLSTTTSDNIPMLIKYDGDKLYIEMMEQDEFGISNPTATQVYCERTDNGVFQYVYSEEETCWIKTESPMDWNSLTFDLFYSFGDKYDELSFNGLTATLVDEYQTVIFTFNNQEQLVSLTTIYTDESYVSTFSDYGTTEVTLPSDYIIGEIE